MNVNLDHIWTVAPGVWYGRSADFPDKQFLIMKDTTVGKVVDGGDPRHS